jgi:hypothetical protein
MDLNMVLAQMSLLDHTAISDIRRYHRQAPKKINDDG